ncbi:DUF397 domain-containing protein [Actinokineospora inagensis]
MAWSDHSPMADGVLVRDSKNPTGPMLSVSPAAWQNLLVTR